MREKYGSDMPTCKHGMATFQRCIDCENEGKDFVPMTTEPKHGLKRYVQTRNRDGDVVLTEDKGQNFLEWPRYVLASEADALIAAKDAEIAGLREDKARMDWIEENAMGIRIDGKLATCVGEVMPDRDGIDAARSKQEKRDE